MPQSLAMQHPLSSCITPYLIHNLVNQPLMLEMDARIKFSVGDPSISYPVKSAIQLAYLMHIQPFELFVTCGGVLLTPETHLCYSPRKPGELDTFGRRPWGLRAGRVNDHDEIVKTILNNFYYYTLAYKDTLEQIHPFDIGLIINAQGFTLARQ